MIENFIKNYTKLIVDYPQDIRIEKISNGEGLIELVVFARKNDVGKIIGKDANTIKSLKTLMNAYKIKDPTSYKIVVKELDE